MVVTATSNAATPYGKPSLKGRGCNSSNDLTNFPAKFQNEMLDKLVSVCFWPYSVRVFSPLSTAAHEKSVSKKSVCGWVPAHCSTWVCLLLPTQPAVCTRELCVFSFYTLGVMSGAAEEVATGAEVITFVHVPSKELPAQICIDGRLWVASWRCGSTVKENYMLFRSSFLLFISENSNLVWQPSYV